MTAPSVELILQKKHASDTVGTVTLRVLIPGTRKYKKKSLGHPVPVEFWDNETKQIKKGHPNHVVINNSIATLKADFEAGLIMDSTAGKRITKALITGKLHKSAGTLSLLAYIERHISRLGNKGFTPKYISDWRSKTVAKIEDGGYSDMQFVDITADWMHEYELKLYKDSDGKKKKPNTVYACMRKMKEILKMAEIDGIFERSQIRGYKFPVYKNPVKTYLTLAQTEKIARAVYGGKFDQPGSLLVACYFLVECYAGVRFSDWKAFEIETLIKKRSLKIGQTQKTKQPIYLQIDNSPRLAKILEYIHTHELRFNLTSKQTNENLKKIAEVAGIKVRLTSHVGRHTFATLMLEKGYSLETVAEMLGVSMATVEIYAKMTRRKIDAEYEKLGGL